LKMNMFAGILCLFVAAAQAGNIAEELTAAGATTLVDLVVKAGLAETLSTGGPFTVFAPTNEAFAKLPKSLVDTLVGDKELLKSVLLYHVYSGEVFSKDITNDMVADSVQGGPLRANIYLRSKFYPGFVTVNGKRVSKADVKASNGVIHMVTGVIYPIPTMSLAEKLGSDPRFSTLLTAIQAAGLTFPPTPVTMFAPTNDAFAKVPADALQALLADKAALSKVLTRHAVPSTIYASGICWKVHPTVGGMEEIATQVFKGGIVKVVSTTAGARVIDADIAITNGVIHAIDTVI